MKNLELLKRTRSLFMALTLILTASTLVFLAGCGDDDGDGGDDGPSVVGTWVISSAVLNEDTPDPVPASITGLPQDMVLPAGSDVTPLFGGIVSQAGPCTNPANTAIELTEDQTMLYVCQNESTPAEETGTWFLSSDESTLTISIVTEVTGSTQTIPLNVSPYTVTNTNLTGTISNFAFFPSATNPFGIQTVSIDIEFTRVQ